jgi:hypothetical protein
MRFHGREDRTPMCELGWKSLGVLELTALPSIDKEQWVPAAALRRSAGPVFRGLLPEFAAGSVNGRAGGLGTACPSRDRRS